MTSHTCPPEAAAARWRLAALALLEQNLAEDAVRALRHAVELNPGDAGAWNDLGVVLEALGNRRDAVHCYRSALRCAPQMHEAWRNLLALAAQAAAQASLPPPARNRAAMAVAR